MDQNPKDQKQHIFEQTMVDKIDNEHDGVSPFFNSAFHLPYANAQAFDTDNNNGGGNIAASNNQYGHGQGQQNLYGNNQQGNDDNDFTMLQDLISIGNHEAFLKETAKHGKAELPPIEDLRAELKEESTKQAAENGDKMEVDDDKDEPQQSVDHAQVLPNANSSQQVQSNSNTVNAQRTHHQQYDINNNNTNNYQGYGYTNAYGQNLSNSDQSIQQYHGNVNNNNQQNTGHSAYHQGQQQPQQNPNYHSASTNLAAQPQQYSIYPTTADASLQNTSTSPLMLSGLSPAPVTTSMNHPAIGNNDNDNGNLMQYIQQNNNQDYHYYQLHVTQQQQHSAQINMNNNNTNSNNNYNNSQFQQYNNNNTNSSPNNLNQHQHEYKQSQQQTSYDPNDMRGRNRKIIGFRVVNNRLDVVWISRDDNKDKGMDSIGWGIYDGSKFKRMGWPTWDKDKNVAICGFWPKPDIKIKMTNKERAKISDYTIYATKDREFYRVFKGSTLKCPFTWEDAPVIPNWEAIYFSNQ